MTPGVALRGAKSFVASCVMRGGPSSIYVGEGLYNTGHASQITDGLSRGVLLATLRSKAERFSEKVRPEFLRVPEFRAQYLLVRHTHPACGCIRCGRE